MPEDRVTITADASQYFDVLARAGTAANRLAGSGERVGAGFLKGERAVETATRAITAGLLTAGDAATSATILIDGLARALKLPLITGAIGAAAVTGIIVLRQQIERTRKASEELTKELGKSFGLQVQGSVDSLGQDIDTLTDKMSKLRAETVSTTSKIIAFFQRGSPGGLGSDTRFGGPSTPRKTPATKEQQQLIEGEKRLKDLVSARADLELKVAIAKRDQNKLSLLQLDYESQRSKLFQGAFKAGLNMVDLMKRLISLQINLKSEILKEVEARHSAVRAAREQFLGSSRSLLKDIGSGQFLQDLAETRIENAQIQRAIDMARELQEFEASGGTLGPNERAIVDAVTKALGKGGLGLADLQALDFSNLDVLSKYNFSGLEPLNGLTIKIQ